MKIFLKILKKFPNFQIMYFKIYGLNPARFLNAQRLICQATLKKLK